MNAMLFASTVFAVSLLGFTGGHKDKIELRIDDLVARSMLLPQVSARGLEPLPPKLREIGWTPRHHPPAEMSVPGYMCCFTLCPPSKIGRWRT